MARHEAPVRAVIPIDESRVRRRTERWFTAALLVKGVDGAAELVTAAVLLAVPAAAVHRLVAVVLARDLLGAPDGTLARHVVAVTDAFAAGDRRFAVVYLGMHGAVKLALVAALFRRWVPAYPVAVGVLGAFVVYELYRAARTGSIVLPVLAVVDLAIIAAIAREYRLLRREHRPVRRARRRSGHDEHDDVPDHRPERPPAASEPVGRSGRPGRARRRR